MTYRAAELAAMAEYMATRGILRCPPAFTAPTIQGERPEREGTLSPLVRAAKYDGCRGVLKWRREPA